MITVYLIYDQLFKCFVHLKRIIRRIAGVIVSVLVLSVVDHWLELRLGQTKEYKGVGMIRFNFGPISETV